MRTRENFIAAERERLLNRGADQFFDVDKRSIEYADAAERAGVKWEEPDGAVTKGESNAAE